MKTLLSKRFWIFLMVLSVGLPLLLSADAKAFPSFPWKTYAAKPDSWYQSAEAKRIAANVLSWQTPLGIWPKNFDTGALPNRGNPNELTKKSTWDNGATIGELRFLARMYRVNRTETYRAAFNRGLAATLQAQYPTGGWPQFIPLRGDYTSRITFNDNLGVNILNFLRDVSRSPEFAFVEPALRDGSRRTFDRGIDCILKCQIVVNGKLTVWCQQHDEKTLKPARGRTYELVSLSGQESAGIVRLLMSIDRPSPQIINAVNSACLWFQTTKITGMRYDLRKGTITPDPKAGALWARYYQIGTNRPFFSDRDGIPRYSLSEIGLERRTGYGWYSTAPQTALKEWVAWKKRNGL